MLQLTPCIAYSFSTFLGQINGQLEAKGRIVRLEIMAAAIILQQPMGKQVTDVAIALKYFKSTILHFESQELSGDCYVRRLTFLIHILQYPYHLSSRCCTDGSIIALEDHIQDAASLSLWIVDLDLPGRLPGALNDEAEVG